MNRVVLEQGFLSAQARLMKAEVHAGMPTSRVQPLIPEHE